MKRFALIYAAVLGVAAFVMGAVFLVCWLFDHYPNAGPLALGLAMAALIAYCIHGMTR